MSGDRTKQRAAETSTPRATELPSQASLIRAVFVAVLAGALVTVVIVLPAEQGVDPTGMGRALGLTQMGEAKRALESTSASTEAKPEVSTTTAAPMISSSAPIPSASTAPARSRADVTKVNVPPNKGVEVKLAMTEGDQVSFKWSIDRGRVNYDLHADRPSGGFHSYKKDKGVSADEGQFTAAFDGYHGWFWRNRSAEQITITLETTGEYREVKRMD
jgi:hypothetical protein